MTDTALYFYLTPMLFIWGIYYGFRTRRHRRATRLRDDAQKSGLPGSGITPPRDRFMPLPGLSVLRKRLPGKISTGNY